MISVTLLQNNQSGEQIKKKKQFFLSCVVSTYLDGAFDCVHVQLTYSHNFFCFTDCKYVAYLLNQHRQQTDIRNLCGAIFCEGAIHKVCMLVCTLRKKWCH